MTKITKPSEKERKYKIINIVLYPTEEQKPTNYVKVLSSIYSSHHRVKYSGDRYVQMYSLEKESDYYIGELCSYVMVNPDDNAFDLINNIIVESDMDSKKGYGLKIWKFWFYPSYHRLVINSQCSLPQTLKFFHDSFFEQLGDESRFAINIEKDRGTIEKIFSAKKITKIEISLSYSNHDNLDGWEKITDQQLRDSNVTKSTFVFCSSPNNPLNIGTKDSFIKGALSLSKSNGSAKAQITNENNVTENINTDQHPMILTVKHSLENVGEKLKQIANEICNRKK